MAVHGCAVQRCLGQWTHHTRRHRLAQCAVLDSIRAPRLGLIVLCKHHCVRAIKRLTWLARAVDAMLLRIQNRSVNTACITRASSSHSQSMLCFSHMCGKLGRDRKSQSRRKDGRSTMHTTLERLSDSGNCLCQFLFKPAFHA